MDSWFLPTPTAEPHAVRRVHILRAHPEIADLFAPDRRMIPVMLAGVAAQLALAAGVASAWDRVGTLAWPMLLLAVAGPGAILSHLSSMFIHEAAHDHAAPTPLENRLWALVANLSMAVPAAMTFRKYHRRHHAWLGVYGVDADLPLECEARLVGNAPARKALWYVLFLLSYFARGWRWRSPVDRWEVANAVLVIAVDVAIFELLGPVALGFLLLSTVVGHSVHPVAAHYVHEHFVYAPGQETYSYYGVLNLVTFNVGYHVEHHDFPVIPGTRLPEYRRRTAEFYDGLVSHRSWTRVMWEFVTRRDVGMRGRIVRPHPRGGNEGSAPLVLLVGPDGAPFEKRRSRGLDLRVGDDWRPRGA